MAHVMNESANRKTTRPNIFVSAMQKSATWEKNEDATSACTVLYGAHIVIIHIGAIFINTVELVIGLLVFVDR
jgi:hypothetical protein